MNGFPTKVGIFVVWIFFSLLGGVLTTPAYPQGQGDTGEIFISPELVGPTTEVTVQIADNDLNKDPSSIELGSDSDPEFPSGPVSFFSDRSDLGEASPVIEETGPNTGIFEFTLELVTDGDACKENDLADLAFSAAGGYDPSIGVCPGDLISITYDDKTDANGRSTGISEVVKIASWDPEFSADKDSYSVGDMIYFTISDADANWDPDSADSVDVMVFSESESKERRFFPRETGPDTGVFFEEIQTSSCSSEETIAVSVGDSVKIGYTDLFPRNHEEGPDQFYFGVRIVEAPPDYSVDLQKSTTFDNCPPRIIASPSGATYNIAQSVILEPNESGTTIYYTIDGDTPTTSSTVYKSPITIKENTKLRFFGMDAVGNIGQVQTELYIIDTTAPHVRAFPAGGTYNTAKFVTLSANEPSTIYYTTNGANPAISSTVFESPILISSNSTLKYIAIDSAGNYATIETERYTIDTVAPTPSAHPAGGVYNASQSVALTVNEPATIYYTTDTTTPTEKSSIYSSPISVSAKTTLSYFAKDLAGNLGGVRTDVYTIDATIPLIDASPRGGTYDTGITVSLRSSEPDTIIFYTTDGTLPTPLDAIYSTPITISSTTTLKFLGVDAAGNAKTGIEVYNITAPDTTPPVVTASPLGATFGPSGTLIRLAANELSTIYFTTNGDTPTEVSPRYSSPISIKSTTTLKFFGKDTAGNSGTVRSETYIIDKTAPLVIATPGGGTYAPSQSVTLSSSESGTTIYYTIGGDTPTTSSTVYKSPITIKENTKLRFFGTDAVGNIGQVQTELYTIRVEPGQATVTINSDDEYTNDTTVLLSINCDNSDVQTSTCYEMKVSVDGISGEDVYESYVTSKTIALARDDGIKTVTVQFRTRAGAFFDASDTIVLDTIAPNPPTIALRDMTYVNSPNILIRGESEQESTVLLFDGDRFIGGTVANSPWSMNVQELAEGSHSITARAKDRAGNISPASRAVSIIIDTIPPSGTVEIIESGDSTGSPSITSLRLTCSDHTTWCSKMILSSDGIFDTESEENFATSKQAELVLKDGSMRVYVKYVDAAGNRSPELSATNARPYDLSITTINNRSPVGAIDQVTVKGALATRGISDPQVRIDWGDGKISWARTSDFTWEDTHTYGVEITGEKTILASLFDGNQNPLQLTTDEKITVQPFPTAIVVGAGAAGAGASILALKNKIWPPPRFPQIIFDCGIIPEEGTEIVVSKDSPEITYLNELEEGKIADGINRMLVQDLHHEGGLQRSISEAITKEVQNEENMRRIQSHVVELSERKRANALDRKILGSKLASEGIARMFDQFVNIYFTKQFVKAVNLEVTSDSGKPRSIQGIDLVSIQPYIGVSLLFPETGKKKLLLRVIFKITPEVKLGIAEFEKEMDQVRNLKLRNVMFNIKPYVTGFQLAPFNTLTEFSESSNILKIPIILPSKSFEIEEISLRIAR